MNELTEEDMTNFKSWSEGNKYLFELLCSCKQNGIKTFASCGGHENGKNNPYLGIIIDNNSMPFIKSMLAQVQDMENITVNSGARHSGDGQLYKDEELKSLTFYSQKHNCCELFYKMKKGIENKDNEVELNAKASGFYSKIKKLNEMSRESLQECIDKKMSVSSALSTKTSEFIKYESSNMLVKSSAIRRFLSKILPFRRHKFTEYEDLQDKYDHLQKGYYEDKGSKMEQYRVDVSNLKTENKQLENKILENQQLESSQPELGDR